jgi:molybdopterin-binding protein
MRLSARNIFKGKILEVTKGATTAHVKIDVGGGTVVFQGLTMPAVAATLRAVGSGAPS